MAIEFGKSISVVSGFDLGAQAPVDTRYTVATTEERDAHVANGRAYEGMLVYVEKDHTLYIYTGSTWKVFGTSTGTAGGDTADLQSKIDTIKSDITAIKEVNTNQGSAIEAAQGKITTLEGRTVKISGGATADPKKLSDGNIDLAVTGLNANNLNDGTIPSARFAKTKHVNDAVLYTGEGKISTEIIDGWRNYGNAVGNVPFLGDNGKLSTSVIPDLAITDVKTVKDSTARKALKTVQVGDVVIETDTNDAFMLVNSPASADGSWIRIHENSGVLTVNGEKGPEVTLTTGDIAEGGGTKNSAGNKWYTEDRATTNFNANFAEAYSTGLKDSATLVRVGDKIPAANITEAEGKKFITGAERTKWNTASTNATQIGETVINATGDATGSVTIGTDGVAKTLNLTLAPHAEAKGTWAKVTVDAKGIVTSGVAQITEADISGKISEGKVNGLTGRLAGIDASIEAINQAETGTIALVKKDVAANKAAIESNDVELANLNATTIALAGDDIVANGPVNVNAGSAQTLNVVLANKYNNGVGNTISGLTIDGKGRVTAATKLVEKDLPTISKGKVSGLTESLSDLESKINGIDTAYKAADATHTQNISNLTTKVITAETDIDNLEATKIQLTGDATATGVALKQAGKEINLTVALAPSGVTANTYTKVKVDAKGRVTKGATLTAEDIPTIEHTQVNGLGSAALVNTGVLEGNVPVLDSEGHLPDSVIKSVAISNVYAVSSLEDTDLKGAQVGDVAVVTPLAKTAEGTKSYILTVSAAGKDQMPLAKNWKEMATPGEVVTGIKFGSQASPEVGVVTLDTSKVPESGENKYLTASNLEAALSTATTDKVPQGNTNKYFTNELAVAATKTVALDAIAKGSGSKLSVGNIGTSADARFVTDTQINDWDGKTTDAAVAVNHYTKSQTYNREEVNAKETALEGKITKADETFTKAFVQKVTFTGAGAGVDKFSLPLKVKGYPVSQVFNANGDMILCDIHLASDNSITVKGADGSCFMFVQELKPVAK